MKKIITNNFKQTQKLGKDFAKEILLSDIKNNNQINSTVLTLRGDLGAGKTTFLQGFAKGLGIKEKILSPTFVILKHFKITKPQTNSKFTDFYHIDCYRLKDSKDVLELDFKKIISDPKNIIAVEWPEKIKNALPKKIISINCDYQKNKKSAEKNKRVIILKM
jgi:tRNA threonylcarbamoyladenosine biosynthesis protein TsaE